MKKSKLIKLILSALFAAVIFISTAFLPRIPFPGGYVHIGDTFIYIAACLLPIPYAAAGAALGGALADLLTGYALWAPFTFVIKACLVFAFTNKKQKLLNIKNIVACIIAIPITVGGYYIAEAIILSSFAAPVASLLYNLAQASGSMALFIIISLALDAAKLKPLIDKQLSENNG